MPPPSISQQLEVYTKGTEAWFPDDQEGWVSAAVVSNNVDDTHVKIVFQNEQDGSKEYVFESTMAELQKTKGSNLPPLRNPPKMENTDDLTNLSYLNEPSVLNTIRTRYLQRNIYTYSGIVLIATNPFARVSLYEPDIIQQYSGRRRGELEPHLFAIAEDAYRCMVREQSNQTIVVSGESGAGKTVSAKYIMRYFATADDKEAAGKQAKNTAGSMTEVEEQILATNPIMEAFGNAKTTRNDNSSRFGKYIEIQFDKQCNIVGAKIRTYLLERSRLIFQPETERNYHIFYQLCAGAPSTERKELDLKSWTDFHYLNQSGTGEIPGVNDTEEFELTQKSLSLVGISVQTQWQIFRLLAALLHIGNIEIGGRNDAALSEDEPSLMKATRLLGIQASEFKKWIVRKQIVTRSEKIVTNLSPTQAQVVRDSVAKYIYANLFEWLVSVVNDSLSCQQPETVATFIGVLDIYGFEHFKKNSFEQFCINYANEKLQQQFNQHVFKLEQEEYVREKIDWKFIEFSDNQKCIEMIEAKMGILSLLDEESRLPSGTDQGFCNKLYQAFSAPTYQDYFKKPRFSNEAFTVVHYAHDVQYEAEGFIDKNKDTVPEEHLTLLQNSQSSFLVDLIQTATSSTGPIAPAETPKKSVNAAKKPTLGSIFKLSLINLMDTIGQTNVHYIRCIKPNEAKVAWVFEPNMVLSQLRACGVLETIRISCAGYPSRWTFEEFADRYYALVKSKYWDSKENADPKRLCSAILDTYINDADKYQIGLTKIFFRAGQLAYMEKLRADRWNQCAILIQKNMRRYIVRARYLRMKELAIGLQQIARKKMGQRKLELLRQEKAAIVIQKNWRRYTVRKDYLRQRARIVAIQAAIRGLIARKRYALIRQHNAAVQIQRLVRGWVVRKRYHAQRNHIIRIQTCVRRRIARRQLMGLRAEARSVSHFKEVSYKLENKVVELTQSLNKQKDEKFQLRSKASQLEQQVRTWIDKYDKLDRKAKDLEGVIGKPTEVEEGWSKLQHERDSLQEEYITSLTKLKQQDKEIARLSEELTRQKDEVSKLRETSQSIVDTTEVPNMSELKQQISTLKSQLSQTLNKTRKQHVSRHIPSRPWSNRERRRGVSPDRHNTHNRHHRKSKSVSGEQNENAEETEMCTEKQVEELEVADITGSPEEIMHAIFKEEMVLQREIVETVVKSINFATLSPPNSLARKDLFYPSHTIAIISIEMCRYGYVAAAERLLLAVMDAIDDVCVDNEGEEAIVPCLYWLSNIHELYSLIISLGRQLEKEMQGNKRGSTDAEWHEIEKTLENLKYDLQSLEDHVFNHVASELKKKLSKMVIPAIVESQLLPGFNATESGRFHGKSLGGTQPAYTMEDVLHLFNTSYATMKRYEIEQAISEQLLTELLKYIGVSTFNDVVMRRNFNSWKRAMQIQYNLTVLEDWCKSHEMADATLQLEHLMQATKLLQLKKATLDDIKIIYDVCWMLTPVQVQKLVQNYAAADYEDPISHDIMRAVVSRVNNGDKADSILLDQVSLDDCAYEVTEARDVNTEYYVPDNVSVQL
ncbi:P-loop containing nucleoside triphosphate hydrolase protein [Radiomyces spectabilis]|uniref:P-loop containing nucleoside triphosphate hydrolase protein n=1 Tax=Radiomyces spectabilis TaxID=64574 RepID=UPI00221FF726|nr:P-loop containing nucleoside triphosphate hydrolase protein [Radiomyces spectabilis]KAI8376428.1 P-loop containing nucleoside triphosphate hydrolase protein [Radiomyces spectabilis]